MYIDEMHNSHNSVYFYSSENVKDGVDALKWMYQLKSMNILEDAQMNMGGIDHEFDENINFNQLYEEFLDKSIKYCNISGTYKGAPAAIGFEFEFNRVFIATRNNISTEYEALAKELKLV